MCVPWQYGAFPLFLWHSHASPGLRVLYWIFFKALKIQQSCSYPLGRCQPFCRTSATQDINPWNKFENNTIEITVTSQRGQWIKQYFLFPSSFQRLVAARLTVEWPSVIGETLWTRTRRHKPSTPSSTMAGMSLGRHGTLPYIHAVKSLIQDIL